MLRRRGNKEGGPGVWAALGFTLTGGKPPQRSSLTLAERVGVGIVSAGVPACSLPPGAPSFLPATLVNFLPKNRCVLGHREQ